MAHRIFAIVLFSSGIALAADAPADSAVARLAKEYDQAVKQWAEATEKSEGDAAQIARYESYPLWKFAPRMAELAAQATDPAEAFAASLWVIDQARGSGCDDRRFAPSDKKVLEILLRDHRRNSDFGPLCLMVAVQPGPVRERFLRGALEQSDDAATRAMAAFGLTEVLERRRWWYLYRKSMPRDDRPIDAVRSGSPVVVPAWPR